MTSPLRLPRLLAARALLWLARRADYVPPPADCPPTLRELALALGRAKLARWHRALGRIGR
jgi:hypothetical protein